MTNWCTKCDGTGSTGNPLANAFFGIFGMKPEVCDRCKGDKTEPPTGTVLQERVKREIQKFKETK